MVPTSLTDGSTTALAEDFHAKQKIGRVIVDHLDGSLSAGEKVPGTVYSI